MLMFLCPKCHRLLNYMEALVEDYNIYFAFPNENLPGDVTYIYQRNTDVIHYRAICPKCKAEFKEPPDAFLVDASESGITPIGSFWKNEKIPNDIKKQ